MQEATRTFTYTARRTTFFILVGSFTFLFLVETGVLALLIAVLIHDALWRLLINGIHALLCLLMLGMLFAPLLTRHRLSSTHLYLRLGGTRLAIPRAAIRTAEPVLDRQAGALPTRARYDSKKRRAIVCFSDQGQILLRFTHPLSLKLTSRPQPVTSLLFNVDQRNELLAVLAINNLSEEGIPMNGHHAVEPAISSPILSSVPGVSRQEPAAIQLPSLVPAMPEIAIHIVGLRRAFDAMVAVADLNMAIRRGEIYGFLGSNGAGKTTTIKMLVGLLQPDAGHIELAGHDVWAEPEAAKILLGYVADRALLYERLTGREFLAFLAQLRGLPPKIADERIAYWLEFMELREHANRLCGSYSFGMKRKLSLVGALLHEPQVLILDEPLNGLDPRSARRLKDLSITLAAQGRTILLSTHDLATAESVCHRVGILHRGCLLAEGSATELRQLASAPDLETVFLSLTSEQAHSEEVMA